MSSLTPIATQSDAADAAIRRWDELKGERSHHEAMWEDIARLFRPQRGGFSRDTPADRDLEKPYSSAPIHAQSNFSAGLYGTLTNPANRWFGFRTPDPDANAWQPMRQWLDTVTDRVLASFTPQVSPFYSSASQLFGDLSSFGNAAQYDELVTEERKILDITLSLAEVVFSIDPWGRINEVVRKFQLSAANAMRMFRDGNLPPKIDDMYAKRDPSKITFYHHVLPNEEFRAGRLGAKGKRWLSRYACEIERTLVREKGYDEMPFYAARWEVDSGQTYGVGPGFVALASARALSRMDDAALRMAQKAADPTLLAPSKEDWALNGTVRPGKVVYNGLDLQGRQMLQPMAVGGGFQLTLQERQQKIEEIRDAFHYTLLQLAGRTGMTATEVMAITEERQRLWAPHQGRVQEEYLAPKISRRFSLLWRAGQLPPPPKGMEGIPLDIQYLSAAAAAQRSVEGNAALRVLQDVAPLIQIMPRISDRLDPDGLLETLGDARGAPARMFRSREDADQIAEARAQQAQQAQMLQAAQMGAGALKDVAAAGAAMQGGAPQ